MFISTFEHSTSAAGFSHVENMLRLQKWLKGRAREIMKDKLLLPSLVPEVMSTLKMFFGRPEHILERIIDKVRKLAPPKEKLESIRARSTQHLRNDRSMQPNSALKQPNVSQGACRQTSK